MHFSILGSVFRMCCKYASPKLQRPILRIFAPPGWAAGFRPHHFAAPARYFFPCSDGQILPSSYIVGKEYESRLLEHSPLKLLNELHLGLL
jgi:hypothetical protein